MMMPPSIPFTVRFSFKPQLLQGEWHGMFLQVQLQQHAVTMQLCQPQTWAGISAGHHAQHKVQDYCTTSPVHSTALLRDSQWKTTMCSSRLSPKVLWNKKKDIDYSWLWMKPTHRKQNWYLSKPRRLFFFPGFDWFCHSLVIPYYFLLHKT